MSKYIYILLEALVNQALNFITLFLVQMYVLPMYGIDVPVDLMAKTSFLIIVINLLRLCVVRYLFSTVVLDNTSIAFMVKIAALGSVLAAVGIIL